jgi:hypothetical protein
MPSTYPNNPPQNIKIDYAGTTPGSGPPPGQHETPAWQGARSAALGRNDGMRDIGTLAIIVETLFADLFTAPVSKDNRVLLMRGLAPDSTQEEIRDRFGAEIVRLSATSSSPGNVTDGRAAIQRVILVRNKFNKQCLGFGFIQLASTHLAAALLSHLISRTAQPVGFVINSRPVACSFANPNAFADVGPAGVSEPWCIPVHNRDRQPPGGIGGVASAEEMDTVSWLKYWDDTCGASELPVALDIQYPLAPDLALQVFLDSLALAAGESNQVKETAASNPGSGSGTPLALGAGGIKMVPLKIGKKKEPADGMVPLTVAGVEKTASGRSCALGFSLTWTYTHCYSCQCLWSSRR